MWQWILYGIKVQLRQLTMQILAILVWTWAGVSLASNLFGSQGSGTMVIDIKPDDPENIVRASSGRVISVAIFGSANLDVTSINPRTIRLNGVDVMLVGKSDKSLCRQTDINEDNFQDLLCDVRTTGFKVSAGEYRIILKAATYDGVSLRGEDRIRIVENQG